MTTPPPLTTTKEHTMYSTTKDIVKAAARAESAAERARKSLLEEVESTVDKGYVVGELITMGGMRIQAREAEYRVLFRAAEICEHHAGDLPAIKRTLTRFLLDQAVGYPDDTWSGRGNDAKRYVADSVRDVLRDLADSLDNLKVSA
jgi:hypothetical protein